MPNLPSDGSPVFHASALFTGGKISAEHLSDFCSSLPGHATIEVSVSPLYGEGSEPIQETALYAEWKARL